jgi:threonine dehydratase
VSEFMSASLPSLEEIRQAQQLVYSVMPPTPQFPWPLLRNRLGTEVWIKHENHTPIGAFKARTAIVYAAELFKNGNQIKGFIAATRGNHGQSVALAAQRFKVPCTIVVPHGNSQGKNAAMRAQGATLIEFGNDFQEAREHAAQLADQLPPTGSSFSPPFPNSMSYTFPWDKVQASAPPSPCAMV